MELEEAPQTAVARMTDSTGIQRPLTWKSWHGWPAPEGPEASEACSSPKNGCEWLHGPYGHSFVAVQLVISGSYIVIQYHRDLWICSVVIYPNDWPWMWRNLDLDLITACFIFNLFTFRSYLGKMFPSRLDIPLGMTRYCGAAAFGIIVWTSRISPLTLTLSHGSDRGGVGNVGQIQTAVSFQNSTDVYV